MGIPRDERTARRIENVLERKLAQVDSPEVAEAVVERVEKIAAGRREKAVGDAVARDPTTAEAAVRLASKTRGRPASVAATLAETAAQVVAPTPEATTVARAVEHVASPRAPAASPEARRGRVLLERAVLRRMRPWDRLDTRVFVWVNGGSHPAWMDALGQGLSELTRGGWFWVLGTFIAWRLGVPRAGRALTELAPSLLFSHLTLEYPVKTFFRRRRPFVDIVRAVVVGRKPGTWSFPSGHSGSSFAAAWVLSTVWPRTTPAFVAIASLVGVSRVYVGAHYPGDVVSGAIAGTLFAEIARRRIARLTRRRGR